AMLTTSAFANGIAPSSVATTTRSPSARTSAEPIWPAAPVTSILTSAAILITRRRHDSPRVYSSARARRPARLGANLSRAHGARHRALRRRRPGGPLRTLPRGEAAGGAPRALRRRRPPRRRLDRGHGGGGQVGARRLHAARDVEHAHRERDAHPEKALRADARLRAHHRHQFFGPPVGHPSFGPGEEPEGVHRARQVQARSTQL